MYLTLFPARFISNFILNLFLSKYERSSGVPGLQISTFAFVPANANSALSTLGEKVPVSVEKGWNLAKSASLETA